MTQQTIDNGDTGLQARTKINENFTDLYTNKEEAGTSADAIDAHVAAPNPHAQYLTEVEANALYAPIGDSGAATITVSTLGGAFEWSQTVAAVGMTPDRQILLGLAATTDEDENCAEMLDMECFEAIAGTDELTINAAFSRPTSGPVKFNWSAL
jgi:hypothetical protein